MGFEVFKRRTRPVTDLSVISIQNRGNFALNKSAFALLEERRPAGSPADEMYVELLYDKDKKLVALRPVVKGAENAYVVRKQPNAATYILTGRGFAQYYGLEADRVRRFRIGPLDGEMIGFSTESDLLNPQNENLLDALEDVAE